jgi:hypothetical protein
MTVDYVSDLHLMVYIAVRACDCVTVALYMLLGAVVAYQLEHAL